MDKLRSTTSAALRHARDILPHASRTRPAGVGARPRPRVRPRCRAHSRSRAGRVCARVPPDRTPAPSGTAGPRLMIRMAGAEAGLVRRPLSTPPIGPIHLARSRIRSDVLWKAQSAGREVFDSGVIRIGRADGDGAVPGHRLVGHSGSVLIPAHLTLRGKPVRIRPRVPLFSLDSLFSRVLAKSARSGDDILGTCYATILATGDRTRSDRFPDCFVIPGNPSTE